jgi:hypothetical protein
MDTRPRLKLLALLGLGLGAFAVLHAAGDGRLAAPPLSDPSAWLDWAAARSPADVAGAATRLVAMAMAGWLVVLVVLGCALRLAPLARLRRVADSLTPLALRRLIEAAVGATASVSVMVPGLATPATAAGVEEIAVLRRLDVPVSTTVALPATVDTLDGDPAAVEPPPPGVPATWIVEPGDDLWSIAAEVLERAWTRAATDGEVAPYWRALVEHNRGRLVHAGDPDLVRPGQTFEIPAPPPAPT